MEDYSDIIGLPHHVSRNHPQMTMQQRAAQFAPFAALVGHEAAIEETARLTEDEILLDEDAKALLDDQLSLIRDSLDSHPVVSITYFRPDSRKQGGSYQSILGVIREINDQEHAIVMEDGSRIGLEHIMNINCRTDYHTVSSFVTSAGFKAHS